MFEHLSTRLSGAFSKLRGQSRLTDDNIQPALREVRLSLIEADVALSVIKQLLETIKEKAIGQTVLADLTPEQAFIKIVQDELTQIMGETHRELNFKTQPPAVFLMVGLQGSGKTTSTAKLAQYLQEQENKKVMLASTDVYRPAAMEQLQRLAEEIQAPYMEASPKAKPVNIAQQALKEAKKQFMDVLIIDTAGRLHIDEDMMAEIKELYKAVSPIETLFVVDSMTGQDAATTARAFHDSLSITGVILTKTDGDARGGAALSVNHVTGQPIKFIGTGEKISGFEPFHPERMASRILGMGDMLSLIEEVERKADKVSSEKLAKKLNRKRGNGFDLQDFKDQILQMNNMGGLSSMMSKLPGMGQLPTQALQDTSHQKGLMQSVAIINSMTPKERRIPKIIIGSRKRRIAQGSGTQIQDVNRLLKQFTQMQKMMKKFSNPKAMKKMMNGLEGMPGLQGMLPDDFK